jgi:hypothetical protein
MAPRPLQHEREGIPADALAHVFRHQAERGDLQTAASLQLELT